MGRVKTMDTKELEYRVAEERGREQRAAGLYAKRAWYDEEGRRVEIELPSGIVFGIPVANLPEISSANEDDLFDVELLGAGNVLHWEKLDADYSVSALVLDAIGTDAIARQFARRGGQVVSEAKREAARANGAKGGRPRKAPQVVGLGALGGPEAKLLSALGITRKKRAAKGAKRSPKK